MNDTWVWDGSNWTQKFPAVSPPGRSFSAMTFDSTRNEIVLFSGFGGSGVSNLNDTWVWDGFNWTKRTPGTSPPASDGHAMAFDAAHGQVVLIGGGSATGFLSDTWIWDGSTWSRKSPQVSPPGLHAHAMAFDIGIGQVLLFGGETTKSALNTTWAWDGSNWTQKMPSGMPSARVFLAMAYDSAHGQIVLFGGTDAGNRNLSDTWIWNGGGQNPAPSLTIQNTWQSPGGGNPKRGDTFTYTIQIANGGAGTASGVNVVDTPDSRSELALQGPTTFNIGTLSAGASQALTLQGSASAAGAYTNAATVTWSDSTGKTSMASMTVTTTVDPQPGDLSTTVTGPVALKTGVKQVLADGNLVYAVNNPGDSLTILNCAGGVCNVTSTVPLAAGAMPIAAATMDIDGDGQNDVIVLNQGTGTVTALLSGSPGTPVTSNLGATPVAFAPFNAGDGTPRIAVAFSGSVTIFTWDGKQFQATGATQPAGISPSAVVKGDFNGDGVDDLLVANTTEGTVLMFLGDGKGGLSLASELGVSPNPVALSVGDVNNDGALDAAVITSAGLVVLLNDGAGNLSPQPAVAAPGAGAIVLADFNGDGYLDAAVANTNGSSVSLFRGDGNRLAAAGSFLVGKAPASLAASDLDGDGAADLITASSGTQDLTLLLFSKP